MRRRPTVRTATILFAAVTLLSGCSVTATGSNAQGTPPPGSSTTIAPSATSSGPAPSPSASTTPPTGAEGPSDACAPASCVRIVVSGDMLFHVDLWKHFRIPTTSDGHQFDFTSLLAPQREYTKQANLSICHLETPVAPVGGPYSQYPIFSVPPEIVPAIKSAGYDACTTASNHSVDKGTTGLLRTMHALDSAGLPHTGTYATEADSEDPLLIRSNGVTIAIIGGTFGLNGLPKDHPWRVDSLSVAKAVAKAKLARARGADLVVGGFHLGTEYSNRPNSQQLSFDRALIRSGEFDFVYNHHAHAAQPLERYNGKWIAYGLGNNISVTSSYYRTNNEFLLVSIEFRKRATGAWSTSDIAWVPATNRHNGQYRWCSVAEDAPGGTCVSRSTDRQIRTRIATIVNSMGAAGDGLHPWLLDK